MIIKILGILVFLHGLIQAHNISKFHLSYSRFKASQQDNLYSIDFRTRMNPDLSSIMQPSGSRIYQEENQEKKSRSIGDVPGDIYNAGKIFVDDFLHVSSEPARWDRNDLIWAGGFATTAALLFAFDQEIYDAIHRNRNVFGIRFLVEMGEFFEPVGLMAVQNRNFIIAMGVGYALKFRPLTIISGEILEAFFIAGLYSEGIKMVVGRKRPNQGEGPYSFTFNDGASFPSGHARNITQAAIILSRHIRFLPFQIFAYTVAGSVCLQRITSESHWPSDVFVGAMFGAWTAKVLLDYHEEKNIVINPRISPESGYMGLDVRLMLR